MAGAEKGIVRTLGSRAPKKSESAIEVWVETRIAELTRRRKASEEAQALFATAERTLEKAKAQEAAARQRLEEERRASLERLAALEGEIRAVTASPDPAAEAAGQEGQILTLEASLRAAAEEAGAGCCG